MRFYYFYDHIYISMTLRFHYYQNNYFSKKNLCQLIVSKLLFNLLNIKDNI